MNTVQLKFVWAVGILLSAMLLLIGVVAPALARSELARIDPEIMALPPLEVPRALQRRTRLEARSESNYYTGLVGPIAILGICAVVGVGRRSPASSKNHDRVGQ